MSRPIWKLDDGREVELEWTVLSWGSCDSWTDPGDPIEAEITEAYLPSGETIQLSEAENERLNLQLLEMLVEEGPPDYEDNYS